MNYVWVFELFWVLETAYMFWEPIVNLQVLIYMILDNMTMFWLWYPANGYYSLVLKLVLSEASRAYCISGPS